MTSPRAARAEPSIDTGIWRLHELVFRLDAGAELWHHGLSRLFSALPVEAASLASGGPAFRIDVTAGPERPPKLASPVRQRRSFGLDIGTTDTDLIAGDGRSWFHVDLVRRSGRLSLDPGYFALDDKARLDLFLIGFNELLAGTGRFDLHAAALARAEAGFLLIGESGTGKSTTALALVASGWGYVSDDAVLLTDDGPVQAWSFRRPFNVDPRVGDRFPSVSRHLAAQSGADGKRFLDIDGAFPSRYRRRCCPTHLVFTSITDQAATTVVPVAPAEALARLIRQSPSLAFRGSQSRAHMAVLGKLVAGTKGFELRAGRDVRDRPTRLEDHLAALI